jgi:Glycosyltransferases, probably involved in cell wall biogenesis
LSDKSYVLVTAARNEAKFIEKTLRSMVFQTIKPLRWAVISDGSTDATDEIVRGYATQHDFIKFIRVDNQKERDFASKVFALRVGFKDVEIYPYQFIGILDADITLKPDYYEKIMHEFDKDPKLGIGGGLLMDCLDDDMPINRGSNPWSVPGGIQLFRRECFQKIGGILPLRYGEEDFVAEVKTRMEGYKVQAFYNITGALHHRLTGTAERKFPFSALNDGLRDYYVGTYLPFEFVKCISRMKNNRPFLLAGIFRLCGYFGAAIRSVKREIPDDIVKCLRMEQKKRFISILKLPFSRN